MQRLQDKVAVVTGAGGGIGRVISSRLSLEGAAVVIADIDLGLAKAAAAEVEQAGGRAMVTHVDITDETSVVAMFADVRSRFGGTDVLVNNAMGRSRGDVDILTMTPDTWMETMAVASLGPMLCAKHAIGSMIERGGGAIVNMSSGATLTGQLARPAYAAAKAAINMLTKSIATIHGRDNIRCNAIVPGMIVHDRLALFVPAEVRASYDENLLLPYGGEPEDIAATVAFLASNDAKFITAQLIGVHGGLYDHHPNYASIRASGKKARPGALLDQSTGAPPGGEPQV